MWTSNVGDELRSHKAEAVRSLLLQSPSLHSLHTLLHVSCGLLLFLHHVTWFLPLYGRSVFEILTISAKGSFDLCSPIAMPSGPTQLL